MKKIISAIVLTGLLGLLVAPMVVSAQGESLKDGCTLKYDFTGMEGLTCVVKGTFCDVTVNSDCGTCCLLNTIQTVTNWTFYILILVVVIMIIAGGFVYITAAGSPERAGKGKGILTYAIIGLAIALLAKIIPSVVKFIMSV